jgi:hypothetical protein
VLGVQFLLPRPDDSEHRAFDERFSRIRAGAQEADVLEALGEPDAKVYEAGPASGADNASCYCLFWFRGVEYLYTVRIDRRGRVRATESGGL